MSHLALGTWAMKSVAGLCLLTAGVAGSHRSDVEAMRYYPIVEGSECRAHDDDHGHDSQDQHGGEDDSNNDSGHGKRDHNNRGRDKQGHHGDDDDGPDHNDGGGTVGPGIRQILSVKVPATALLRVDKSSKVIAAATNTGCQPAAQDDYFLLRPNGKIEPATAAQVGDCKWSGDFRVPGRFQQQSCKISRG